MNKMEVEEKLKDNKLPKGWIGLRLGDLGKFKTSSVDKKVDKNEKLIKLINYMDVYRKNFIDNSLKLMEVTANSHEITVNQVRKGDILFTPSSETPDDIGHSTVVLEDLPNTLYSYHLVRLKLRENIDIDLKFRGYFCNFKEVLKQFEKLSTGVTRYTLSKKDFEEVEIILPISLPEQRKIAEILETFDNAIEKTDAIIGKYKRIKQGLMQDFLTRGIDENGQIRSEKTHKFKDSPLGRIPEEWKVVELEGVATLRNEKSFPTKDGIYIGLENLEKETGQVTNISFSENIKSIVNVFYSEDVLFGKLRPNLKKFWHATFNGFCSTEILVLVPLSKNIILNGFLFLIIQSDGFLKLAESKVFGTKMPRTSWNILKNYCFTLPPLSEQQRISSILSQIDETIEKEQNYKEKLERIKQGLMEDLLTGKVRVLNVNQDRFG